MANDLVTRIRENNRREMRYLGGMLCMHRERYLVYCSDLAVARVSSDTKRTRELLQDLTQFAGEIDHIVNKQRSVSRRKAGIAAESRSRRRWLFRGGPQGISPIA